MITTNFESSYVYYLVGIALILTVSSYRSLRGRRYRPFRIFLRPFIYLFIGIALLIQNYEPSFLSISLLGLAAGFLMGLRLGSGVSLFYRRGDLYYRRSYWVYLFWLGSFLLRVYMEVSFSPSAIDVILVDTLLMFSSGLLIGESYHITRKARELRGLGFIEFS